MPKYFSNKVAGFYRGRLGCGPLWAASAGILALFTAILIIAPFVNERTVDLANAYLCGLERVMTQRCEFIFVERFY